MADSTHEPKFDVDLTDHLWIPLADGTRLAARLWRPVTTRPVPVVLEYIPYRLSDGTAIYDPVLHAHFAAHGIASIRVDIRGSGNSGGEVLDEYVEQELVDAEAVIAWLASQSWCNGSVGMFGISWGGFNALQLAARQPPALKSIITVCSSDDRYGDDVHYRGGTVLLGDMLPWATTMMAFSARPPDPEVCEDWQALWQRRLESLPDLAGRWLTEQVRSDYWRQGSVSEDYALIRIPVFVVGGLADGYTNSAARLERCLPGSHKTLIGPWGHSWPNMAAPGPNVDFPGLCVDWWRETFAGVTSEDATYWCRAEAGGFWMTDVVIEQDRYHLDEGVLVAAPGDDHGDQGRQTTAIIPMDSEHGGCAGEFCPASLNGMPGEQSPDDERSLVYQTAPIESSMLITGQPTLKGKLVVSEPVAQVVARLCAVDSAGRSRLLSRGMLNLARESSMTAGHDVVPGTPVSFSVTLDFCCDQLVPGEVLRLSLASGYWPMLLPAPVPAPLLLWEADCRLDLPIVRSFSDATMAGPNPDGMARRLTVSILSKPASGSEDERRWSESARIRYPHGMETWGESEDAFLAGVEPTVTCHRRHALAREGWSVEITADSQMVCRATEFVVETKVVARLDGELFAERLFDQVIARNGL